MQPYALPRRSGLLPVGHLSHPPPRALVLLDLLRALPMTSSHWLTWPLHAWSAFDAAKVRGDPGAWSFLLVLELSNLTMQNAWPPRHGVSSLLRG